MSDDSSDDGDYGFGEPSEASRRYPVHDCCEYDSIEDLRRLIKIPAEEDEESDESDDDANDNAETEQPIKSEPQPHKSESDGNSSSDDNDSSAAAHAAAIGHSPQPVALKASKSGDTAVSEAAETASTEINASVKSRESVFENEEMPMETSPAPVEQQKNSMEMKEESNEQAIERRKSEVVQYVCPYNLNERDSDENTALHVAIHARKLEHVKLLVEMGASVHKKSDGSPPIHAAISIGSVQKHAQFAYDCVKFLAENDGDLTSKDDSTHTPLYLACMYNLPKIADYILSTESGASTLNMRADRSQGRPLHVAAKFDSAKIARGQSTAVAPGHPRIPQLHHHPDGTVVNTQHRSIPAFVGTEAVASVGKQGPSTLPTPVTESETNVTMVLLKTPGIEVDAINTVGQSPLHIACSRGNWNTVRLLQQAGADMDLADRRGYTPGQLAHKRGMLIPTDLLDVLGGPPSSGIVAPPRDLIVDPDSSTLLLTHELCVLHRTCPPIRRNDHDEPPPENVRRLSVLVDQDTGILRTGEFDRCRWENETRRAAMVDILKCHEYNYVETISQICSSIPDHPSALAHLDADTTMSRWTFESALRAAGSVCEAVDRVISGDHRNSFCAVRPPGHHAGPRGIVRCANDPEGGSHGFCFLNNVAIGAAYARSMYRNEGIKKVAIVDFDVHHGNGTEEIIRQLVPAVEKTVVKTPFAVGEFGAPRYRPWLDETDIQNVFFASAHGFGPRGMEDDTPLPGWFYPASGKSHVSDAIKNPSMVDTPNMTDFLLSQTWTRMGEETNANCCKILNCGLGLPSKESIPGMQRLEVRDTYRNVILPRLREFDPDIIFISAGFDAHKKDTMNFGYVGMVEDDYEWVTEQLVRIANTCCNGRVVSVLEGGYKIHGGIVSPFARSVASHVRALSDGGRSRELYDVQDCEWESQFEKHLIEEKERKRQQKKEKLLLLEEQSRQAMFGSASSPQSAGGVGDDDIGTRKRKRNQVDYRALHEQLRKEGFIA